LISFARTYDSQMNKPLKNNATSFGCRRGGSVNISISVRSGAYLAMAICEYRRVWFKECFEQANTYTMSKPVQPLEAQPRWK
jgi:hypothetical protein